MKVYLDDERGCPVGWHLVKTADACIDLLKTGRVEALSLDHDLAAEHYASTGYTGPSGEKTGQAVVDWMAEHGVWPALVRVHTMNPTGRENMLRTIRRYAPETTRAEVRIGWCRKTDDDSQMPGRPGASRESAPPATPGSSRSKACNWCAGTGELGPPEDRYVCPCGAGDR